MATPPAGQPTPGTPGSNGRPSPNLDAEQLRERMATVRGDLERDIAGASQRVHDATHWEYYVKKFPFACLGAAVLAGYALVPSKKPGPIVVSDEQIKELADAGKLHIVSEPKPAQTASFTQKAMLGLGTIAARAAVAYVGNLLGEQGHAKD
ncbi:hypothetical protein NG895_20520 [Aeoliella sp. ICT_H6.2]|uniref:DUF3618 domain-containing protein n=1 Tax=Aeoliella straminimaris TaxID=2954799 RepID=A0A9X2FCA2_9BACT|nr:hypothetical protein [Aeoliella straminimaris]MCO6046290.1 hypothetical protein [Aeoliella straminimaris]